MLNIMSIKSRAASDTRPPNELRRFLRFGLVGLSATLLDFTVLTALKYFFGWPTLLANLISYSCGALNSYTLNRRWVFPETKGRHSLVQLSQFISINLVGLLLNMVLLFLLEIPCARLLANAAYSYIPAKIGATLLVFLWNFFANRYWTFNQTARRPKPNPPEAAEYKQTAA